MPDTKDSEKLPVKNKGGRPTKYKEEYVEQAFVACSRLGATIEELADLFKVNKETVYDWMRAKSKFSDAIRTGRDIYDTQLIEKSLKQRATGYEYTEEKVFCKDGEIITHETTKKMPPDATSMIFWLKNRNPERWRDKIETELSGTLNLKPVIELGSNKDIDAKQETIPEGIKD